MNSCINVKHVTKNFGFTCALNNVNLQFGDKKMYGLLGRNGAGKTTLLNIISNRIFADSGETYVDEIPSVENDTALRNIFIMGAVTYYPERMTIKEIIRWTKNFYPNFDEKYALDLAKQFDLDIRKSVKSLSTGYNTILKLIIALSVNTKYLFLDEPVLGLDANHRDLFYRLLLEKQKKFPCTIVLSTHLIEEVSSIIDEVIVIKKGEIIVNEPRNKLLSKGYTVTGSSELVNSFIKDKDVIGEDQIGGVKSAYIMGEYPRITPSGIEVSELDLQKLFIMLTKN